MTFAIYVYITFFDKTSQNQKISWLKLLSRKKKCDIIM